MAIDYIQKGKIKTVISLVLRGYNLDDSYGSFKTIPADSISKNSDFVMFFETINDASNLCGPKGHVVYRDAGEREFTMRFDCPTSDNNVCTAEMTAGDSSYTITGEVPKSGHDIDYKWTIKQAKFNEFIDAPIFSKDLLNAPQCGLISKEKMLKYIDGRSCLYLKNVFEVRYLPTEAIIWCSVHDLFLTPQSKAILTRDLAQKAMRELSPSVRNRIILFDHLLTYHENISKGDIISSERERLLEKYSKSSEAVNSGQVCERDFELLDVIKTLMEDNLEDGWRTAVNTYVRRDKKDGVEERRKAVIELIEDRL